MTRAVGLRGMQSRRRVLRLVAVSALLLAVFAVPAGAAPGGITVDRVLVAASDDLGDGGCACTGPDENWKDFDLLVAAILADDLLVEALNDTGRFSGVDLTVLAPNDRAFLRYTDSDTEEEAVAVLAPMLGTEELRETVLYHVIPGQRLEWRDHGIGLPHIFTDKRWKTNVWTMANEDVIYARDGRLIDGSGNRVFPWAPSVTWVGNNGVIRAIREVMTPPDDAIGTIAETISELSGSEGPDTNAYDFDILAAAVAADGQLSGMLGSEDPSGAVTALAPVDRAFIRFTGEDTEAAALAALEPMLGTAKLRELVLYHLIEGAAVTFEAAFASDPFVVKRITMANGELVKIRAYRIIDGTGNRVWPKMGALDLPATNGILHTVYEVLQPPAGNAS